MPSPDDEIVIRMTRRQALGLEKLADLGIRASEAFALVQNASSAEQGLNLLRQAFSDQKRQKGHP